MVFSFFKSSPASFIRIVTALLSTEILPYSVFVCVGKVIIRLHDVVLTVPNIYHCFIQSCSFFYIVIFKVISRFGHPVCNRNENIVMHGIC